MSLTLLGGYPALLDVYQTETVQSLDTGARAETADGRVFYYCKNASGSTMNRGQVYVRQERIANHTGLATATDALVVGARQITGVTLGATALTANNYAYGWVSVETDGGNGLVLPVAGGHDAANASAVVSLPLAVEVPIASDASTTVSLIHNDYDSPQISNTDQADVPVGVPVVDIANGAFGWLQTYGMGSLLADETFTAVGQAIVMGTGVAGRAEEDDTATTVSQEYILGYNVEPFTDGQNNAVFLTIRK